MKVSIDIGTSYSSICILGPDGKVLPVEIGTGASIYGSKHSLPSAVFLEDSGNLLVGQAAMNNRKRKPQNFHMEFKRELGQDIPVILGNTSFQPEQFYTTLFRHMRDSAQKVRDEEIELAYLTYPATYGQKKRERIIRAAQAAGLFRTELVDEPTAAAMSYCAEGMVKPGQTLLVYDFGGGTFDVSLLKYEGNSFTLLAAPEGLERCGGVDMDRLIFQDMLKVIDPELLQQIQGNKLYRLRLESQLAELAVKAKHHLSSAPEFAEDIAIGFDMVPYRLTGEQFNGMIARMVGNTVEACRQLLEHANLKVSELSAVLLVGGTSRVPLVQKMVKQFAGDIPVLCSPDLELAVVQGALRYTEYQKKAEERAKQEVEDKAKQEAEERIKQENEKRANREADEKAKQANLEKKDDPLQKYRENPNALLLAAPPAVVKLDGTILCRKKDASLFSESADWTNVVAIARGLVHRVGLRRNGTVVAVADSESLGRMIEVRDVSEWKDIVAISCGAHCTVGLRRDGTILGSGSGSTPFGWADIVAIACGRNHTVGLRRNGTVVAVGNKYYGMCDVSNWTDIVAIACGHSHTVGLRRNGTIVAVGANGEGQCKASDWTGITGIACGSCHTVGLRRDGTVVATGNNEYGQCNVSGWKDIVAVSAGYTRTIGLRSDGTVLYTDFDSKKGTTGLYFMYNFRTEVLGNVF